MRVLNKATGEEKDLDSEWTIVPDHPLAYESDGMRLYLVNYGLNDVWFSAYSRTKPQEYVSVMETNMVMHKGVLVKEPSHDSVFPDVQP